MSKMDTLEDICEVEENFGEPDEDVDEIFSDDDSDVSTLLLATIQSELWQKLSKGIKTQYIPHAIVYNRLFTLDLLKQKCLDLQPSYMIVTNKDLTVCKCNEIFTRKSSTYTKW